MQQSAPIVPFPPPAPFAQREPTRTAVPLVLASPHSGAYYPPEFVAQARLDQATLRKSEDCYVDDLFGHGPELGATFLRALYPRAYVDLNRDPYELDPDMFDTPPARLRQYRIGPSGGGPRHHSPGRGQPPRDLQR